MTRFSDQNQEIWNFGLRNRFLGELRSATGQSVFLLATLARPNVEEVDVINQFQFPEVGENWGWRYRRRV